MLLKRQICFENEKHVNCELLSTDLKCDQASPVKPTTKKKGYPMTVEMVSCRTTPQQNTISRSQSLPWNNLTVHLSPLWGEMRAYQTYLVLTTVHDQKSYHRWMDCHKELHHMNVRLSAGMLRAIKSRFTWSRSDLLEVHKTYINTPTPQRECKVKNYVARSSGSGIIAHMRFPSQIQSETSV